MGKSKDGNVTCFMYTQMRIVGLVRNDGDATAGFPGGHAASIEQPGDLQGGLELLSDASFASHPSARRKTAT